MIHGNFGEFSCRVYQTHAVGAVGKGLQAVISILDDKCMTRFVGEMTSLLAS